MENEKKCETISLDLNKFKIDPKDISKFVSTNPVETLVNIVSEAVYKDNELKVLQEIIKKIGEENLKLKEITQNYEAYKGNKKEMFGATIIFADKEYFNNGFFKDHEKEQKNKIKKLENKIKKLKNNK